MSGILVMVMTHGRKQYIEQAIPSLDESVEGPIVGRVIHDDSGDARYRGWLSSTFPHYTVIAPLDGRGRFTGRIGCCAAYASAMKHSAASPASWIFSTEDDFVFDQRVDLQQLVDVLSERPYLAQMTLRRQPWGREPADGGFVAEWPNLYEDATDGVHHWMEQQRNWSNNPNLFRRALAEKAVETWPIEPGCEITFKDRLLAEDSSIRFGLWGKREDESVVTHIGHDRAGGYGY